MTFAEVFTNAEHDSHHTPTLPESVPRLRPVFRIPGPVPMRDVRGRSAPYPFVDDDHHDAPNDL